MAPITVKVRPIPTTTDKSSEKSLTPRVYVNKENIFELTGTATEDGRPCFLEKRQENGQSVKREAVLWAAADPKLSRAVVQVSKAYQDACDLKLGDDVTISYEKGKTTPEAGEVIFEDITADVPAIKDADLLHWEWSISCLLEALDGVYPGLSLKRVGIAGGRNFRNFKVTFVNNEICNNARFVEGKTQVHIRAASDAANHSSRPAFPFVDVPPEGLEHQVEELNDLLLGWVEPLRSSNESKSCGIVLHGGHGTGKTLLLKSVMGTGWGTVHRVQPYDKLSIMVEIFQKARDHQPSIVVMDGFEKIIEKDRNNRNAVIQEIGNFLDRLAADTTTKNERPKVIVIATCLDYLTDMPPELADGGRFKSHIHLPLPDMSRRRAILSSFKMDVQKDKEDEIVTELSGRTHAYNGKDLSNLVEEATRIWLTKLRRTKFLDAKSPPEDYISREMLEQALLKIRPSAMHDINLKPPPVHWDDIGGQDEVKEALQEAIAMATVPKEELEMYIGTPPKGFLLYGPPGCSKTMAAQALATEADLNFFAVKGAELLNMYVGESERQIRRLFERAREAAPSIIFFDEIDSIGGQRSGFGSMTSGGGGGSGLNVLTTLLNEMQGFELTQGVLVLAATNRPQALDPALLRPGRFDKLIYVKPPNHKARLEIFRKFVATRKVAPNVYPEDLASRTEGFSGAEIVGICTDAGSAAWRRERGLEDRVGITSEGLTAEIKKRPSMITPEMLESYESWASKFQRS